MTNASAAPPPRALASGSSRPAPPSLPRPPAPAPWSLLALCTVGWTALAWLFAGGSPPAWLLPVALAASALWWWRELGRAFAHDVHERPPWTFGSWLLAAVVLGGSAVIAWGALATPERSWDGFATWGLAARHLLAGDTLASPFFADPAVFNYSPGYPLLQPVLMQQLGAWLGVDGARLFYVLAWLLLVLWVRGAVLAAGASAAAARVAAIGAALVPMFVEPGSGSAESGFADLLLAALLAAAARAVLAGSAATALCVGLLLPVAKNEGVLHIALWIGVAAAWRQPRTAGAFAVGGALALLAWLPVQQRLLHPGAAATLGAATFAPLLLLAGAWLGGALLARVGTWARCGLLALPLLAAPTLPGQLQQILGGGWIELDVAALPRVLGELGVQFVWLRRFGATFVLLAAAAWLAWRERASSRRWHAATPLLAAAGLFAAALVGFLIAVPAHTRELFVREGLGRYLAQLTGVAWIAIGVLLLRPLAETAGPGAPATSGAPPRWLLRLLPAGSARGRAAWIAWVTLRKAREGPGPWLRAVKKGVFQLLPAAWRARLLRWAGDEPLLRRAELLHGGADAGVERPDLVSVVLPVFDQADMLGGAIDSVLAQSHPHLELIVVDDGSTDGARDVLARHVGDPRVRVLVQPNQGLPKALSTGFECATGEFFTWTSADNLMERDCLARLVAFLRSRPEAALVWADHELIDERGAPLVGGEFRVLDRTDAANPAAVRGTREPADLNRREDNFIGPCFLYRGRVGRLLGDYNPELGLEDYDYWMRINRLFRIAHLGTDELLYRYRVHGNTLSARACELRLLERSRVLMRYERQRGAWVNAPLRVLATAAHVDWLRPLVQTPDTLAELTAAVAGPLPVAKTLLVVGADRVHELAAAALPPHVAVAVFFADVDEVHAAAAALRELPAIVFAASADVAARLAVHTRVVFGERPGAAAWALALRFAANSTFFRSTRDAARLRRVVPEPLDEPRVAVLLQVERGVEFDDERSALAAALAAAGHRVGMLAIDGRLPAALPAGVESVRIAARDEASYVAALRAGGWQLVDALGSTFGAEAAARAGVRFVLGVPAAGIAPAPAERARWRDVDAAVCVYACTSPAAFAALDRALPIDVAKVVLLPGGGVAQCDARRRLLIWTSRGGTPVGVRTLLARLGDD